MQIPAHAAPNTLFMLSTMTNAWYINAIEVSTLLELSVVWVAHAAVIPAAAPRIMPAAGYTARWH